MNIGDKIPEILGIDQDGREIKASDYQGRKIVLYSYPKANTSGCTAEACSLQAHKEELAAAGYDIIGVSKDKQTLQKKFADTQGQQGQADPAEEIRRHSGTAVPAHRRHRDNTLAATWLLGRKSSLRQKNHRHPAHNIPR